MDADAFWELIERSRQETSEQDARLEWLLEQLTRRPAAEIVDFQDWVDRLQSRAYGWPLWGAAHLVFELVMAHPVNLAGLPEVVALAGRPNDAREDDEGPDWQGLHSLGWAAYERVVGDVVGLDEALDARWDDRSAGPGPPVNPGNSTTRPKPH